MYLMGESALRHGMMMLLLPSGRDRKLFGCISYHLEFWDDVELLDLTTGTVSDRPSFNLCGLGIWLAGVPTFETDVEMGLLPCCMWPTCSARVSSRGHSGWKWA